MKTTIATYAPGPWKYIDIGVIEAQDGECVAECVHGRHGDLLAAAPDMLDALEELCAAVARIQGAQNAHGEGTAVIKARAAIAKAQGRI